MPVAMGAFILSHFSTCIDKYPLAIVLDCLCRGHHDEKKQLRNSLRPSLFAGDKSIEARSALFSASCRLISHPQERVDAKGMGHWLRTPDCIRHDGC
jgi:hypothetical protein